MCNETYYVHIPGGPGKILTILDARILSTGAHNLESKIAYETFDNVIIISNCICPGIGFNHAFGQTHKIIKILACRASECARNLDTKIVKRRN